MSFQMRSMRRRASRVTNAMTSFCRSVALVARKNTSVPKNSTNWPTAGVIASERGADDFGRIGFDRDGRPGRGGRHDRALDVVQHRDRIVEHAQLLLHGGADFRRARDPFGSGAAKKVISSPISGDH